MRSANYFFPPIFMQLVPHRRRRRGQPLTVFDAMNHFFDDSFFEPFSLVSRDEDWPKAQYVPSVDLAETDKEVRVVFDLPGFDAKDVKVSIKDGALHVSGSMKEEKEEKDKRYYCRQCSSGSFVQQIMLPDVAEDGKAKSSFRNGKLTVMIPKKTSAKEEGERTIDIEVE
jgi:HSP20 family protein